MTYELLTRPQVEQKVQLTCSTIYRLMREGRFPLPIKVGPQAVRWRSDELADWIEARPRATGETVQATIPYTQGAQFASAG